MSKAALRETKTHRALHRPQMIWGGERELMLSVMVVAGGLIVAAMNIVATVIGLIIWAVSIFALRQMAKADPVMSKVYLRQLKYRSFYPAFSRPWRVSKSNRIY